MRLEIRPITLRTARAFIAQHHRHNLPPRGWRFGVGLYREEALVGVGVAGSPVARMLDDGLTLEITRTCVVDVPNGNSRIYGALGRAAAALGYRRLITYTLTTESGVSLRASGFSCVAEGPGGKSWASNGRGRYISTLWGDRVVPQEGRLRWERMLGRAA